MCFPKDLFYVVKSDFKSIQCIDKHLLQLLMFIYVTEYLYQDSVVRHNV